MNNAHLAMVIGPVDGHKHTPGFHYRLDHVALREEVNNQIPIKEGSILRIQELSLKLMHTLR